MMKIEGKVVIDGRLGSIGGDGLIQLFGNLELMSLIFFISPFH